MAPQISLDQPSYAFERRSITRTRIARDVSIFIEGTIGIRSFGVRDVTNQGAGLRVKNIALLPLTFDLSFDKFRTIRECRLIWRDGDFLGVAFDN